MTQLFLPMRNATRSAALDQDDPMAILQSAYFQPDVKVSHGAGSLWCRKLTLLAALQIASGWNGFVYICDGQGSISGTAAAREQVGALHDKRLNLKQGRTIKAYLCAPSLSSILIGAEYSLLLICGAAGMRARHGLVCTPRVLCRLWSSAGEGS